MRHVRSALRPLIDDRSDVPLTALTRFVSGVTRSRSTIRTSFLVTLSFNLAPGNRWRRPGRDPGHGAIDRQAGDADDALSGSAKSSNIARQSPYLIAAAIIAVYMSSHSVQSFIHPIHPVDAAVGRVGAFLR